MHLIVLALLLFTGGELILRNGKRISYEGTYEVKGEHVFFHDANGDLFKLPLSIVDLDRTRAAEEQASQKKAEPEDPRAGLTAFERFVMESEQTEDGEGGNVVVLTRAQQAQPSRPTSSPATGTAAGGAEATPAEPAAGTGQTAQPSAQSAGQDCSDLRAKLSITQRSLTSKQDQLNRENARRSPSESRIAQLEVEIARAEAYIEQLEESLKRCP